MLLPPNNLHSESHFSCPTCRDEGLPARVIAVNKATNMATAQLVDEQRQVALDLVDGVEVGDYLLVHLDMAIAKLNPADVVEA